MKKQFFKSWMVLLVLMTSIHHVFATDATGVTILALDSMGSLNYSKSNASGIVKSISVKRSGTGSADVTLSSSTGPYFKRTSKITFTKGVYIHAIGWMKAPSAAYPIWFKLASTDGQKITMGNDGNWHRFIYNASGGQYFNNSTTTKDVYVYITHNGTANQHFYFDDVIYYHTTNNVPTDTVGPTSVTSAEASTTSISWTKGADNKQANGNTGLQKTLIFKRTSGSSDNLTLNDQCYYSMRSAEGPIMDQSGNWTLVDTIAPATESKSGTFSAGDRYAIVHRDLVYNYSTPTYVTVAAAGSTWYVKGGWNSWGATDNLTGSGTELSATVNITTAGKYEFKIFDSTSSGTWWGNGGNIGCNVSGWTFESPGSNCTFFASETGNYTFTFNTSTKKLSVTYPTAQGKYYYKNTGSWSNVAVYRFKGDINNGWPGSIVVETEEICGDTYYFTYADPGTTLIFNNNDGGSQTGNMAASGNAGKYVAGTDNSWNTFPTYTVTYNANGDGAGNATGTTGSVPTDASSPYACGSTVTVLGNTGSLAKDGYNFIGWNTAPGGGGTSYVADATFTISANTTLYAQWELIPTYDVIYNTNGGTGGSTASQTDNHTGDQVTTSANGFTRSGYKFKWWNTAADGSGEDFYPGEKVTIASADVNLYAQWEQVAANQEFWTPIGASASSGKAISITEGDMSITSGGATDAADINVDVTASACIVNRYNSSVDKHAKVLAIKANDKYIEIHFTDGSPINKLWLGATPANADSKNIVVVYSATSDFTTAGGAAHEFKKVGSTDNLVALPGNTQATKSFTDVSPSTENTYYYARIYRRITTANTVFDNTTNLGSGTTVRIYSIKAQKGVSCVAPATVNISGGYHFYPGETIELSAAPTGSPMGSPVSYQWKKDGVNVGTNSATFTKANATAADAGSYTCTISYGDCSTTSAGYQVKCMQILLKTSAGVDISTTALTKVDATHATVILNLTGGTTYNFRITDGCNNWYGNSDATGITSSNCTNWTMPHDADCKVTTGLKTANYTFNFDFSAGLLGSQMKVSVVYPGGNQAADKVIYWDNNVLNWADGSQWYRIGRSDHHNKTQLTKVYGTANLYKVTTSAYDNFEYWHIANNQGNGDGNLFWTKGDAAKAITNAMAFEGAPVTADAITITPGTDHSTGETSDNDNCQFYNYTITPGMKTQNVAISPYSNGTITVNYTNTSNVASTLTSGNADLAHTVILTSITAVPDAGYDASAITINGNAYAANHVVTEATTIAASFTPHVYTITLNKGDHGASNQSASVAYLDDELTSITHVTSTGYTLTGYYDGETKVLNANGTFASANVTGYITDSKWTKTSDATLTAKWTAKQTTITINANTANHGSSTPGTVTATYGNALPLFTAASGVSGYSLTGYYTDATGGTKIINDDGTLVASTTYTTADSKWNSEAASLTLYAQYEEDATLYTVSFNTNGGSSQASITQASEGASITMPLAPTKSSNTFQGWVIGDNTYAAGASYTPTADITAYASWQVTCAGGGASSTTNVAATGYTSYQEVGGSNVVFTSAPSLDFKYKTLSGTTINNSTDAATRNNGYACQIKSSSSNKGSLKTNSSYNNVDSISFYFAGSDKSSCLVAVLYSTDNFAKDSTTLLAATAIASSGSNNTFYKKVLSLPVAKKANNLTFKFRFTVGGSGKTSYIDSLKIYTSSGSGSCYYVTYDGNGAEAGLTSDPIAYNALSNTVTVLDNGDGGSAYTKDGYTFTGWNTKSDGSGASFDADDTFTITKDTTLYAQWTTGETYTLAWNSNGGSALSGDYTSGDVTAGTAITAPDDPTLSNYTFDGWNTANDGSGSGKASTMPSANTTYYAVWKQVVTLKTGSQGSGSDKTPYVYKNGTALNGFSAHSASGYTLTGYYTEASAGTKVLNADGSFAATAVTDYITDSKWSRTGAAPTLYAQWRAAAGKTCYTWDAEETHPQTGTTNYDGLYLNIDQVTKAQFNSGGTNDTCFYTSGRAHYMKGHINGTVIDSLKFKASTSDASYKTVTVAFCSTYPYDTAHIIQVNSKDCKVYNVNKNDAAESLIKIKAPAGTKSFALGRNFESELSVDGTEQNGAKRYFYYVEVCTSSDATHTISYNNGGGTGSMSSQTSIAHDGSQTLTSNTFTAPTNFAFAGWVADVNVTIGGSTVTAGTLIANGAMITNITTDIALTAKWSQSVTLNANTSNHGSGDNGSATVYYNAAALSSITHTTAASGYKLSGYYTAETEGTKVLNADGTFAGTAVTGYITDGKWTQATSSSPTLYAQYESAGSLIWNLTVNSSSVALGTNSKSSAFTEISTTNMTNAAATGLTTTAEKKSSLTGKIESLASEDGAKYVSVSFVVADGYKFIPSSASVIIQPVGTDKEDVKLVLSDGTRTITQTKDNLAKGKKDTVILTNSDATKYMMGTATLKIYVYGAADTYRLGTPITIEGEVEEACATMPSFTRLSYGETSYTVDDTPDNLEVIGGTNITTYLWKQNTVNDRSGGSEASGTNNTATYTPSTTSAGTTYYWCEMTNSTCGITIKTSAVGITVNESRTDATVTWSDPGTIYYGGGGYTIKATVDQTTWAGAPEDLSLSAPAGIRIYNVTRGTTSSQDWIQANFDIQTTFDRETYSSTIPFVVSADAKTGWNAISDQNDVAYEACAEGSGDGSALILVTASMSTAKSGMSNYWEATGVGKLTKNYGSSLTSSEDAQTIEGNSFTHRSASTNSSWMVQPYIAGVTKIRLYFKASAAIASGKLGISKVLYDTEYFSSQGDRAVVYSNVETSDDSYAASDLGWVEFELPEMAANSYCYFTTSTSNLYIYGVELFSGSIGTGGTITTGLTWSSGTADGGSVTGKTQSSANFTITATRDAAATVSLGAVTYSSSNTSCATINATTGEVTITATGTSELSTTIKATLAASGCYKKKEITYTLTIPGVSCAVETGTLTSDVTSKCSTADATLTLTSFESGATLQWYKGESTISDGATYDISDDGTTLVTKEAGTYSVVVTNATCSDRSNSITISNKSASASVTKIVDEWYVKNGRLTPDIELWSLSEGARLGSVAWSPSNETGLECIERDGIIYLEGKEPNESGEDVVYTLTATILDACNGEHEETTKTIKITHQKNTDKHVLAFVVNGTDKGGFTEGLTAAQTTDVPLYKTIAANFDVQATNCYASDDEKKVKQYYSQFDILCITDYPNSNKTGANSKKYVDVLGKLIDVRPILTMEAFVSDKANWKAKGISGSPKSPTTRQYSMDLQCKDHEIFSGTNLVKVGEGDETMYRVTMVAKDSDDYKTLDATYGGGEHAEKSGYEYGSKPALQGFTFSSEMLEDGLLPLGLIDDGAGNDLQVGIERQAEMSARLMVIGINSYAMERLTKDGQTVVINALNYLMKKKEEEIADCSITFIGGDETNPKDWETASNWKGGQKPDKTTREIRILAPVVITGEQNIHAQAPIKIASGGTYNDGADRATGKITIEAGGALRADGEIQAVTAPAYSKARPTSVGDIHIKATSEKGNGTLIFKNDEGTSQAIVEMYSKASFDGVNVSWQYIAVPFATTETAYENYYGSWLYRWAEDCSGWEVIPNRGDVGPWIGYCITQVGTKTYTMTGKLVETTTQEFSVPANKQMVIGNSWTAPIQVKQFTDDDFSGLDANVYLFNTGYDPNGTGGSAGDRYAPSTYVTIPIHAAEYTGDSLISSLQAFIVDNTAGGSAQTLTLDYDRHVRPTRATDKVNAGQMHAPVRRAVVADGEPEVLKLFVSGSRYDDRLVVLAREDFSAGFDNGWDGQNINEQGDAPMMYALREDGTRDAVSAVPEFEGTVVGFQAGEDDVYTMSFVYAEEAEPLYILDTDNETYTRVLTDNTYTFMTSDKDAHSRFVLTRTSGMRNPTGCENVDGSVKAKKFILNDKMYIMVNGVMYDATGKLVK